MVIHEYSISKYRDVGANEENSWPNTALDTIIFGLRNYLRILSLEHRHIMFGHAFGSTNNKIAQQIKVGGGALMILNMIDCWQRVAAFGYQAGCWRSPCISCWVSQKQIKIQKIFLIDKNGLDEQIKGN